MTINVDAAAFQHDALVADRRLANWAAEQLGHAPGSRVIPLPIRILRPAIEMPVGQGHIAGRIDDEYRAIVARPNAVSGNQVKLDPTEIDAGFSQNPARPLLNLLIADEQADRFGLSEATNNLGIDPRNSGELVRPIGGMVRPREPGGAVWFPFGRHAVCRTANVHARRFCGWRRHGVVNLRGAS